MSSASIATCGSLHCRFATNSQNIKKSFCHPTCKSSTVLESCKPSNCSHFWDTLSEACSVSPPIPDETNRILDFPECKISDCPERKLGNSSENNRGNIAAEQTVLQVQLCGKADCCTRIALAQALVNFNLETDLITKKCDELQEETEEFFESQRNKIYYCVSPTVYNDSQMPNKSTQGRSFAKIESIRLSRQKLDHCVQKNCCKKKNSKKATDSEKQSTQNGTNPAGISAGSEVLTSFYSFNSNQAKLKENDKSYNNITESQSKSMKSQKSPHAFTIQKEFTSTSLTEADDFPPTPAPSAITLSDAPSSSPFRELPSIPQNIRSRDQIIVQQYITSADEFAVRNPSEVIAILKAVYLTTSDDFPPSPQLSFTSPEEAKQMNMNNKRAGGKDSSPLPSCCGSANNLRAIISEKKRTDSVVKWGKVESNSKSRGIRKDGLVILEESCCIVGDTADASRIPCPNDTAENSALKQQKKKDDSKKSPTDDPPIKLQTRATCYPNTCDKLNLTGIKKWKNCCNSDVCPINDPTSSTYDFLLKVRMCCQTRGCQLAAKICDIYEPLVEFDKDFEDVGEPQYHFLGADVATDAQTVTYADTHPDHPPKPSGDDVSLKSEEIPSEPIISTIEINKDRKNLSSISADMAARRASAVSWSPRGMDAASASQEQVISRATAAADKFRQTPAPALRHGSVFGQLVRKPIDEPKELTKTEVSSSEVFNKSQIDNVNPTASQHRQQCCPSLRAKFKKKKKRQFDDEEPTPTSWNMREPEKRKTLGNFQIQEKNEELNHMLNKM